jgi:hypothetical protein
VIEVRGRKLRLPRQIDHADEFALLVFLKTRFLRLPALFNANTLMLVLLYVAWAVILS